jgi:hypothetical protein
MVYSSTSPSTPFYNNQSITQTERVEEGEQFLQVLHSIPLKDKTESVTAGLQDHVISLLKKQSSQNVQTISNYVLAMNIEVNPSIHHRSNQIRTLSYISEFPFLCWIINCNYWSNHCSFAMTKYCYIIWVHFWLLY